MWGRLGEKASMQHTSGWELWTIHGRLFWTLIGKHLKLKWGL